MHGTCGGPSMNPLHALTLTPALLQIRGNAPNAQIVVVGLPDNVVSTLRSPEAAEAFIGNATGAIRDLKDGGFQRLNFFGLPPSVKQVRNPPG